MAGKSYYGRGVPRDWRALTGDTYPIKDQLKSSFGARWDADVKAWYVSPDRYEDAQVFVNDYADGANAAKAKYQRDTRSEGGYESRVAEAEQQNERPPAPPPEAAPGREAGVRLFIPKMPEYVPTNYERVTAGRKEVLHVAFSPEVMQIVQKWVGAPVAAAVESPPWDEDKPESVPADPREDNKIPF